MKKTVILLMALVMMLSILAVGCQKKADTNTWDYYTEKGSIVLGLDASFPPMGYTDKDGQIKGFDIDIAKEVCKRLNIELKLQPIDWDSNILELDSRNIDCLWNGVTITEERKKKIIFSDAYMKNRQVIVVKNDSAINTLTDLSGKKLALQSGSTAATALDKATDLKASLKEVVALDDNVTALLELDKNGVDAVLLDEIVARYYITENSKDFRVISESLADEEYGIGFRKTDTVLRDKFNETLKAMAADGTLATISNKWFSEDVTTISK
jgi:polar amino acid transport system substrate-binding protein